MKIPNLPNCNFVYVDGMYTLQGPHHQIADFVQDVSGYWYVWFNTPEDPSVPYIGGFDEYFFYWCFEKLKELNKPMDDSLNEYFTAGLPPYSQTEF